MSFDINKDLDIILITYKREKKKKAIFKTNKNIEVN